MEKADIEGKTIRDLVNEDTQWPEYNENGPPPEALDYVIKERPYLREVDNISVFVDFNDWILVYVDKKLKAVFGIYEFHGLVINKERSFVLVHGHEDINIYWLDNGEFVNIATR